MGMRFAVKLVLQVITCLCLCFINPVWAVGGNPNNIYIVVYVAPTADSASDLLPTKGDTSKKSVSKDSVPKVRKTILGAEQIIFKDSVLDGQLIEMLAQIQEKPLCTDQSQNLDCIKVKCGKNQHFSQYTVPHKHAPRSGDVQIQETTVHTYLVDVGSNWPASDPPSSFLLGDDNDETTVTPVEVMVRNGSIYPVFATTVSYTKENHESPSSYPILISGKITPDFEISTPQQFPSRGLVAIVYENTLHGLAIFENSTLSFSSRSIKVGPKTPVLYYVKQGAVEYPAGHSDLAKTPLISINTDANNAPTFTSIMRNFESNQIVIQTNVTNDAIKAILNQMVVLPEKHKIISGQRNTITYLLPQSFNPENHYLAVYDQADSAEAGKYKDTITLSKNEKHPGPYTGTIKPTFLRGLDVWSHFAIIHDNRGFIGLTGSYEFTGLKSSPIPVIQKPRNSPLAAKDFLGVAVLTRTLGVWPRSKIKDRPTIHKIIALKRENKCRQETISILKLQEEKITKENTALTKQQEQLSEKLKKLENKSQNETIASATVENGMNVENKLVITKLKKELEEANEKIAILEKQNRGELNINPTARCPLPKGDFNSTICDMTFLDHGTFLQHLNAFHIDNTSKTTIAGKISCPLCMVDIINMDVVTGPDSDDLATDSFKLIYHLTSSCKQFNKL